ncbi:protein phosphatase 1 regulatory subunit 14B [Myotis lucifugus]|nr:protein phosphatase 1 regulatory subunit 14B [Myotis lucifugus]
MECAGEFGLGGLLGIQRGVCEGWTQKHCLSDLETLLETVESEPAIGGSIPEELHNPIGGKSLTGVWGRASASKPPSYPLPQLRPLSPPQEEEIPELEIDVDELLDMESDDTRAARVKELLVDCYKPTEAFISGLLDKIRGMQKLSTPQKK